VSLQDNFVRDLDFGVLANVADYSSPIYVQGGSILVVATTNTDSGSDLTVTIQYRECILVPYGAGGIEQEIDPTNMRYPGFGPRVRTVP
jgi:hypothetical protein